MRICRVCRKKFPSKVDECPYDRVPLVDELSEEAKTPPREAIPEPPPDEIRRIKELSFGHRILEMIRLPPDATPFQYRKRGLALFLGGMVLYVLVMVLFWFVEKAFPGIMNRKSPMKFVVGFPGILAMILILQGGYWMVFGGEEEPEYGEKPKLGILRIIGGVIGFLLVLGLMALMLFTVPQMLF